MTRSPVDREVSEVTTDFLTHHKRLNLADGECRNTKKAEWHRAGGVKCTEFFSTCVCKQPKSATVRRGYDSMFDEDVPMEEGRPVD